MNLNVIFIIIIILIIVILVIVSIISAKKRKEKNADKAIKEEEKHVTIDEVVEVHEYDIKDAVDQLNRELN